jgi:hypothetical protein
MDFSQPLHTDVADTFHGTLIKLSRYVIYLRDLLRKPSPQNPTQSSATDEQIPIYNQKY